MMLSNYLWWYHISFEYLCQVPFHIVVVFIHSYTYYSTVCYIRLFHCGPFYYSWNTPVLHPKFTQKFFHTTLKDVQNFHIHNFERNCEHGIHKLKFHLLYHVVEYLSRFCSLNIIYESPYDRFNTFFEQSYRYS